MRLRTTRTDRQEMRNTGDALTIGLMFGVAIAIGYGIGTWVDNRFHVAPWGSTIGALVGVVVGFVNLIEVAQRMSRAADEEDRRKKEGKP